MTKNVVDLDKQRPILRCECGCLSFFISKENFECCNCGAMGFEITRWVEQLPAVPLFLEESDDKGTVHRAMGTASFAMHATMKMIQNWASNENLSFVAAYSLEGAGKHWMNVDNDEDKAYVVGQLEELLEYVKSTDTHDG